MRRPRQHADRRSRERRHRLAHEAARLMAEGGIRDHQQARLKAAERMGIRDEGSLPRNAEIDEALREYQRLFQGGAQAGALRERREAALEAMEFFRAFQPRLVGRVLDGTADAHTPVAMHLHADDADEVARFLDEAGIPARPGSRRVRLDRAREREAPAWSFEADGLAFEDMDSGPGCVAELSGRRPHAALTAIKSRPGSACFPWAPAGGVEAWPVWMVC